MRIGQRFFGAIDGSDRGNGGLWTGAESRSIRPVFGTSISRRMRAFAAAAAMAAGVAWEKNHFSTGQRAGKEFIRWRAKRCFDLHPFLVGEAFNVVKPAAANDANAMFCHGGELTTNEYE